MPEFNPSPNERITIAGQVFEVMPHPAVPTFAFGQEGRKAFVYQIRARADNSLYALKKFKPAYRLPELVDVCDELAMFAQWEGLEVCDRVCLSMHHHKDVLSRFPDLEFSVLMPWITGTTWYDVMVGEKPLTKQEAIGFASAVAQVLAGLEEAGLAHCDISAANVIINPVTERAHLIDVEDIYAPGWRPPAALPAGTDGYAHRTAAGGQWCAEADRFAGAIMICEMAAWHDPTIRHKADEEHFFSQAEMQQDSPRYRAMRQTLDELDHRLAELFDQAWFSETLEDCPRLNAWQDVLEDLYRQVRLAAVVGSWQPIAIPGVTPPAEADRQPLSPPQPSAQNEPEGVAHPAERTLPPAPPQPIPTQPVMRLPTFTPLTAQPAPPPTTRTPSRPPVSGTPGGGPVAEWRPLTVPQEDSYSAGMRPISVPQEEVEAPVQEKPRPFDISPAAGSEAEVAAGAEDEGYIEDAYEGGAYDDAVYPEIEAEEIDAAEDPYDEEAAYDENMPSILDEKPIGYDEGVTAEPEETELPGDTERFSPHLLKPVLDVSHIDNRNRPFLVWTESALADHYLLQESRDPQFSAPKQIKIKGGETRWSPLLGRSGRMYYRVRAEMGHEVGPWSEVLVLRFGD